MKNNIANTIRYYLYNIDGLKEEILRIERMIHDHKNMEINCIKVNQITDMPLNNSISSITSRVELISIRRADYISSLEQDLFDKSRLLNAMLSTITYLRPLDKQIIELKYRQLQGVHNNTWHQVADKVGYTVVFCQKIEGSVIKRIIAKYYEPVRSD